MCLILFSWDLVDPAIKERTFVYQMKVRPFYIFGTFSDKIWQNQGKIREITRCSGHRYCARVFYARSSVKKHITFVVLCSNKEQQKHCVVRSPSQNELTKNSIVAVVLRCCFGFTDVLMHSDEISRNFFFYLLICDFTLNKVSKIQ